MASNFILKSKNRSFSLSNEHKKVLESFKSKRKSCLVMGATGSIGKSFVSDLLELGAFEKVVVLTRRSFEYEGPGKDQLKVVQIADFENPPPSAFAGSSVFFCCHGTTRAQAGSADAFVRIDKGHVLTFAKNFKEQNQNENLHFLLVTSTGSNPKSWLLYPKTKGELEEEVANLGFHHVSIFRPAMLLGRPGGRFFEDVGLKVLPVIETLACRKLSAHVDTCSKAIIASAIGFYPPPSTTSEFKVDHKELWNTKFQGEKLEIFENGDILQFEHMF